jgi:hypothetical protein
MILPPIASRFLIVSAEQTTDIRVFKDALRRVLQVTKSDLKELLAKEKAANADKPKRGPKPASKTLSTS